MALRSGTHLIGTTLSRYIEHPLVRAVAASGDSQARWRAAETAAVLEATLNRVRRLAGIDPPIVFCRSVEAAMRELRVVTGRYWSRDVEAWRAARLRELGALVFEHVAGVEIEVHVGRDLHLARRDGDA